MVKGNHAHNKHIAATMTLSPGKFHYWYVDAVTRQYIGLTCLLFVSGPRVRVLKGLNPDRGAAPISSSYIQGSGHVNHL